MTADGFDGGAAPGAPRAVGESVVEAILDLVRAARPGEGDAELDRGNRLGAGTARRAGADAGDPRARADRRPPAPSLDDVVALAEPVLKHRMALTFAARAEGETIAGVDRRLVDKIVR